MKKFLLAAAVLLSMATVASADPLKMNDQALDQTTAGLLNNTAIVIQSNTAVTQVNSGGGAGTGGGAFFGAGVGIGGSSSDNGNISQTNVSIIHQTGVHAF